MLTLLLLLGTAGAADWPDDLPWQGAGRDGVNLADAATDAEPRLDLTNGSRPVLYWSADPDRVWVRLVIAEVPAPGPAFTEDGWGVLWDVDADGEADALLGVVGGTVATWSALDVGWEAQVALDPEVAVARVVERADGSALVEIQVPSDVLVDRFGWDPTAPVRWTPVSFVGLVPGTWADLPACTGCGSAGDASTDPVTVDADDDGLWLPWERRAGSDANDADSDDDGLPDGVDPGPVSCDTDHDGVLDSVEAGLTEPHVATAKGGCFVVDADPSTTTDPASADTDGGGIPDGEEDRDGDGRVQGPWETDPNDVADDEDLDEDGLADVLERVGGVAPDSDGDTLPDDQDPDSDNDKLPDGLDGVTDPDGDGLPAFRDVDADGDGIPDVRDGTSDVDGDGLGAWLDTDSDGDGLGDGEEGVSDRDGDGLPNYLDEDSDGDGIPDGEEGVVDLDCDGRPDFVDAIPDDGFCDTDLPTGAVDDAPFGAPFAPLDPVAEDDFRGCATSPAPAGVLWLLLPGLLLRRRTR